MKKEQVYGPASYGVQLSSEEMALVLSLLIKEGTDSDGGRLAKKMIERITHTVKGVVQ